MIRAVGRAGAGAALGFRYSQVEGTRAVDGLPR